MDTGEREKVRDAYCDFFRRRVADLSAEVYFLAKRSEGLTQKLAQIGKVARYEIERAGPGAELAKRVARILESSEE